MQTRRIAFPCVLLLAVTTAQAAAPQRAFQAPTDPETYLQMLIASGLPASSRQELSMMTSQHPQLMVPVVFEEIERLRKLGTGEESVRILCHALAATTDIKALERLLNLVESDFVRFSPHVVEFLGHARSAGEAFRYSYAIAGKRADLDDLLRGWLARNCVTDADRAAALEAARERGPGRNLVPEDPVLSMLPASQHERILRMSMQREVSDQ